jgi:uncharacterized membrane protein YbaN (DUF454 family)
VRKAHDDYDRMCSRESFSPLPATSGPYIRGARAGWRIPRRQAMQTIAILWISMGVTAWLTDHWWVRGLLLAIAARVSIFLERRSRVPAATKDT